MNLLPFPCVNMFFPRWSVNSTVTGYAYNNLKFSQFQCITIFAGRLNNFEGSLSCYWNFMIHQVTVP